MNIGETGSFGEIIFEVSSKKVKTFDSFKRQTSAKYAKHDIVGKKTKLQFTGLNLKEISFSIKLSTLLGVNVEEEIEKLNKILESEKSHKLILANEDCGNYALESFDEDFSILGKNGAIKSVNINLKLIEDAD